jgi:chromosome segregation ATPase
VTKKVVGKDPRAEADDETVPAEQFRVDRVFGGGAPKRESLPNMRESVNRKPATLPPISTGSEAGDTELALRRQLSRLQRQLSDAQRELANKDEELAGAVETRVDITKQLEETLTQLRDAQIEIDDLKDAKSLAVGIEQRLQDAVAAADELNHQLERERSERATIEAQLEQTSSTFEKARVLWKEETALAEQLHAAELEKAEQARRAAIEAAEAAKDAAIERATQAHDAEQDELRAAHERELSVVRGELEPKVAEARNLAGEIERLTSELAAARSEHMRELGERAELFKWEQQQATDTHAAALATAERKLESEKAAVEAELAAAKDTLGITERNATLREQLWEQTTSALRESQKKLQQELAEAKERATQAEGSKVSLEQRLATTQEQLEDITSSHRDLELRVNGAEAEARRNMLDRERFAAYLEEGLAMLGAVPPAPIAGEFDTPEVEPREPHTRESSSEVTINDRPRRASDNPPPRAKRDSSEITAHDRPRRGSNPPASEAAAANAEPQRAKRDSASPSTERAKRDSANVPPGPTADEVPSRDSDIEMTLTTEPEPASEPDALPNPPDPHNDVTRA